MADEDKEDTNKELQTLLCLLKGSFNSLIKFFSVSVSFFSFISSLGDGLDTNVTIYLSISSKLFNSLFQIIQLYLFLF